jgi:phosphate:Na+ symporter
MVGLAVESLGFPNPITVDFAAADAATKESLVASLPYSVAVLHSIFNIITTLILVWFIPQLVKMVTWMVPGKGEEKEAHRLKYIGAGNIGTGDLALNSAKLEVVEFGKLCRRDLGHIRTAINATTRAEFDEADKKLVHYEEVTDNIEREIAVYLREVSKHELSEGGMARIRELYRIIGEMESLGDSGETVGKILSRVWEHDCEFTEDMLRQLNEMVDLVDQAYEAMDHNLATPLIELTDIRNAEDAEKAINACRDRLRAWHLSDIEKSSYPYETGSFYMDLINTMEKMGDFIINISQSVLEAKVV